MSSSDEAKKQPVEKPETDHNKPDEKPAEKPTEKTSSDEAKKPQADKPAEKPTAEKPAAEKPAEKSAEKPAAKPAEKKHGGLSEPKPADKNVQELIDKLEAELQSKHPEASAGKKYEHLKAISYAKQLVAGTNYFIKVSVDHENKQHMHVRVFVPLPIGGPKAPQLRGLEHNKTSTDPITYIH